MVQNILRLHLNHDPTENRAASVGEILAHHTTSAFSNLSGTHTRTAPRASTKLQNRHHG